MQAPQTKQLIPATTRALSHCGLGGVGLEGVEVLVGLGLSAGQARVYLVLLKVGMARAHAIARLAGVHRQEVYRLLESLQQLGLVRQNMTVPATFSALPMAEGIELLLEQKTSELTLITRKSKRLTKRFNQPPALSPTFQSIEQCFGTIVEGDRGKRYCRAIEESQLSIEAVCGWLRFKKSCFLFEAVLKSALRKGVTLHVIAEKPPNHHLPRWIHDALTKYPNFSLKTVANLPAAAVTLFDQSTVALAFSPNASFVRGPELWSTHTALTVPCQAYFNAIWTETQ